MPNSRLLSSTLRLGVHALLAAAAFLGGHAQAGTPYTLRPLGPEGGVPVSVSINNRGDVLLGLSPESDNGPALLRLPADGPTADLLDTFPNGAAQNNAGALAGVVQSESGDNVLRRWESGQFADVTVLPDRAEALVGFNDAEQFAAVGLSGPGAGSFVGDTGGGPVVDLGDLGSPTTIALALSETGLVVGSSRTGATPEEIEAGRPFQEAFVFDGAISGLGFTGSAFGVNSDGVVVGEASIDAALGSRAFVFDSDNGLRTFALDGRSSVASDINDSGMIVGTIIDEDGTFQAFVASAAGDAVLLEEQIVDSAGWTVLSRALGINQRGQIVGIGQFGGETRAFLATPVPEPNTCLLVAAIVLFSGRRACLR